MSEHLYTYRKTSDQSASIPQHSSFQPRPFVVQSQTEEQSEQPDTRTELERAERYGHRLNHIKFSKAPVQRPVPRIVQAKLTIGDSGDQYEQEADRVAASVVQQINAPAPQQSTQSQSVQREAALDEDDELTKKPEINAIQRQEEPEEELQAKPEITSLQRQEEPEEEIQAELSISDIEQAPLTSKVQRKAKLEDEELQAKSTLQRREAIGGGEASMNLESAINRARSGGQPLESGLQRSMGQAMGADFSRVKIHTDAQANQLNQSIQAKAFATGQDVFFRQGEYNPRSREGQELLAHELTHVVQQEGGTKIRRARAQEIEIGGAPLRWRPKVGNEFQLIRYATEEEKKAYEAGGSYDGVKMGGNSTKKAVWFLDPDGEYNASFASGRQYKVTINLHISGEDLLINFENPEFKGEAGHPDQIIVKENERGAYGIGRNIINRTMCQWTALSKTVAGKGKKKK